MNDRTLREPQVHAMTGLGRTTRWEMERRGEFPCRRRIVGPAVGWLESEVLEWLRSRQASSTADPVGERDCPD
jgi:prophage regulatory protein